MNHILIPCYSTAPDRSYDAVVLAVNDKLLQTLAAKRKAFDVHALTDENLYVHEYAGGSVHILHLDEDDGYSCDLDSPGEPVELTQHLTMLGLLGPWHLTDAANVYLKVVKEGFFYTWDGRQEKHAPSEIYESETFTLAQLETLSRSTKSRAP